MAQQQYTSLIPPEPVPAYAPVPSAENDPPPAYTAEAPAQPVAVPSSPLVPPPSFQSVVSPPDASQEVIGPTLLLLAGQSVHPTGSSAAPALYRMNRGVASLSLTDEKVMFERIETSYPAGAPGTAGSRPKSRPRHVFDLMHQKFPYGASTGMRDIPYFYLRSTSRRTFGEFGLKVKNSVGLSRSSRAAVFKGLRLASGSGHYGERSYEKPESLLFKAVCVDGVIAWWDAQGVEVATEGNMAAVDAAVAGATHETLQLNVPMRREVLDVLVGLWCLRLWHESAQNKEEVVLHGLDGVRRKFALAKGFGVHGGLM